MNIVIYESTNYDDLLSQRMEIDGKEKMSVYPLCECLEDAILERDLISCSDVVKLMEIAYKAGQNDECFTIQYKKEDK